MKTTTKAKTSLSFLFAVGALASFGSPAGADSVAVFFTGGGGYALTNPFSGPGTVYAAISASPVNCPNPVAGCPGADVEAATLNYTSTPVAITATSSGAVDVIADYQPAFGGMGLNTGNGDDQIEGTGILRLHFASAVTLTGVATLFDPGHAPFGNGDPLTGSFLFCAGNSACTPTTQVSFSAANSADGTLGTASTGTDFAFAQLIGTGGNVEYYVSGLTWTAVPGPIVGAGLPGLIAACGGLLALARRRRRQLVV